VNLEYSDEQRLLQDSVTRFLAEKYRPDDRRRHAGEADGFSRDMLRAIADLGWLGLGVPEEHGGLGGGAIEVGIVMAGIGRALVLEPCLQILICARLISALGSEAQRERWLPTLIEGRAGMAFAHEERRSAVDTGAPVTRARQDGSGWRIHGRKLAVPLGDAAETFLVSATAGDRPALFLVAANADGVRKEAFATVDGGSACHLELNEARVDGDARLGEKHAAAAIDAALDFAAVAVAHEALGCMDALLEATVAYTKTREQFGRPLAANQVLRHRMADMALRCEETRGLALRGALASDYEAPARARAASAAKYKAGKAGQYVADQAVQLHGGMGVTEELNVGGYLKRLIAIDATFGSPAAHLRRHAALAGKA
jgi:alkylation response protein AidB-like acyl-CoA dehydrogenase